MTGNYTQYSSNAKRLNHSFWMRLKQFEENVTSIPDVVLNEVNNFEAMADELRVFSPYKYGGLSQSWTVDKTDTPSGVSVKMYFADTPHEHLEPGNEYTDKFTNPTLVGWLGATRGGDQELDWMEYQSKQLIMEYRERIRNCWKEVLK